MPKATHRALMDPDTGAAREFLLAHTDRFVRRTHNEIEDLGIDERGGRLKFGFRGSSLPNSKRRIGG